MDTVVFDKTGTLTEGRPVVAAVRPAAHFAAGGAGNSLDTSNDSPAISELLELAAAVEGGSAHPLAAAIVAERDARGQRALPVDEGSSEQVRRPPP